MPSKWSHQKPVYASSCSWKPEVQSEKPLHLYGPPTPATATVHRLRPIVTDTREPGFPQSSRPGCCWVRIPMSCGKVSELYFTSHAERVQGPVGINTDFWSSIFYQIPIISDPWLWGQVNSNIAHFSPWEGAYLGNIKSCALSPKNLPTSDFYVFICCSWGVTVVCFLSCVCACSGINITIHGFGNI